MIIRTAEVSMVVTDAAPALKSITELVAAAGGYVADSKTWRENEQLRARVSTRIPAEQLDATLEAIKTLAVRVERENVGGKDVTEEFSDLNAQLVNLEATEKELRELLTEVRQKTQKAEDVLQVYQELTKVRGEIERIKGRMQFLSNQTALATATFDLIPDALAKPVVEPGWRPLETLRDAGRALVNALKGLVDLAIWLIVYLLPLLIVIAIPIVGFVLLIRWLVRRRRSRAKPDAHLADKA
jgi:Flp pilus assembly protein TadB